MKGGVRDQLREEKLGDEVGHNTFPGVWFSFEKKCALSCVAVGTDVTDDL